MRKIVCIALLLLWALSAPAQHYVGVKGGYGAAQGRVRSVYGKADGTMMWNKYTAGLMWRYYSPQQVVGGLQAELEYQMRGYRIYDGGNVSEPAVVSDTTSYRVKLRTVSSVTLPLIWQPHLYMFNRHVRVFASAGVTLSYNLGLGDTYSVTEFNAARVIDGPGESEYHWEQTRTVTQSGPYKMQTAQDVRWNYGWLGGLGVGVMFDRWEVFAEGRYYFGMSDIMRADSKYRFNSERLMRSELDNLYITVGVFFRLGKGGITEPPLRRRRAAAVGGGEFKNIKLPY
jgi:hypothetical protein